MVVIQIETLHTLGVLIFTCIYFCKLKKSYFASICFCKWKVFENFKFINFSPKEKTIRKRRLNQWIFGLCFCQDQREDMQSTLEKLVLLIVSKKSRINQHFLWIPFFMYFFGGKYEFCAYLACIHFRE